MRRDPVRDGAHETVNEWQTSLVIRRRRGPEVRDAVRAITSGIPWQVERSRRIRDCGHVGHRSIDSGFALSVGEGNGKFPSGPDDNGNPLGLVTYWALKSDVSLECAHVVR